MYNHTFTIPVYQESPYLEQCIQSLLQQTVKSRIIITTSTPGLFTQNLAQKYGIPYFVNNSGKKDITSNWNFALSKVTTPYATIAHQDDIYMPAYTETVLAAMNSSKDALIAFTNYAELVHDQLRGFSLNALIKSCLLFPFYVTNTIKSIFMKKMVLSFGDPICCPSVMFNLAQLPGFNFSPRYSCVIDWYAWYGLANEPGAFVYVSKKLVSHRIHSDSETTQHINNGKRKREELELFEMMWGKRTARFIAWAYSIGHKDNVV